MGNAQQQTQQALCQEAGINYVTTDAPAIHAQFKRRSRRTYQVFGVIRHTERADCVDSRINGEYWTKTEDFWRWPHDPPLSDEGARSAVDVAQRVHNFAAGSGTTVHMVVSSPYLRCVETARAICQRFGVGAQLVVDNGLAEVYGPSTMGDFEPCTPLRPRDDTLVFREQNGQRTYSTQAAFPQWPEDVCTARRRYAKRLTKHLHCSVLSGRNFILVTHAEAVGTALTLFPSKAGKGMEVVGHGGMLLAKRRVKADAGFNVDSPLTPTTPRTPLTPVSPKSPSSPSSWHVETHKLTCRTRQKEVFCRAPCKVRQHKGVAACMKLCPMPREHIERIFGEAPASPAALRRAHFLTSPKVLSPKVLCSTVIGSMPDRLDAPAAPAAPASLPLKSIGSSALLQHRAAGGSQLTPTSATYIQCHKSVRKLEPSSESEKNTPPVLA